MMLQLARRNNVKLPYANIAEIRNAYNFTCLQDFLDVYYLGMSVLQTREDFFELAFAYLQKVHSQNVTHVEIFFDPQGHTERGIPFDIVLSGITDALEKARTELNITSRLIMCFLRHLSEKAAFETLDYAEKYKDQIYGIGLDSSENGNPPSKFEQVFARARKLGFALVAHAGEEGPPQYVYEALDQLCIQRIDHGNRALEDAALTSRIARQQIALTVCPLSNLKLAVISDMRQHPLRQMLQKGLLATVNSDDPSYFGGYINENFIAVQQALDLTMAEIIQLGRNSFIGSFLDDHEKTAALENFDNIVAKL